MNKILDDFAWSTLKLHVSEFRHVHYPHDYRETVSLLLKLDQMVSWECFNLWLTLPCSFKYFEEPLILIYLVESNIMEIRRLYYTSPWLVGTEYHKTGCCLQSTMVGSCAFIFLIICHLQHSLSSISLVHSCSHTHPKYPFLRDVMLMNCRIL